MLSWRPSWNEENQAGGAAHAFKFETFRFPNLLHELFKVLHVLDEMAKEREREVGRDRHASTRRARKGQTVWRRERPAYPRGHAIEINGGHALDPTDRLGKAAPSPREGERLGRAIAYAERLAGNDIILGVDIAEVPERPAQTHKEPEQRAKGLRAHAAIRRAAVEPVKF